MSRITYLAALAAAQREEMRRDERVFLMGEDIVANIYGTSGGLVEEFGAARVRNTPISEAGFVGAAVGAAMTGLRPIVHLSSPFAYVAMDQLVNHAAKTRYMFGGQATLPVVFRMSMHYQTGFAAQHSDRPYPMFMNIPGFKIIAPATPADAKGLLKSAIRDDNVVLCFEDDTLNSSREEVPEAEHLVPLGVAALRREGRDVTLVAVAGAVRDSQRAAQTLANEGLSAEVVDVRTLVPLDVPTILASVAKTGRLVIVDVANRTCGAAAEISAIVAEEAFEHLRAPIRRVSTPQTHVPFNRTLERAMFPTPDKIAAAARAACGLPIEPVAG